MSYRSAVERVKKLEESQGTPLTKLTESPFVSSVSATSEESQKKQSRIFERMRSAIQEPGTWHIVTVRKGRIKLVRNLKSVDPSQVVAVWEFRRVRIGEDDWMVGQRDDGKEVAWCVRRSGSKCLYYKR